MNYTTSIIPLTVIDVVEDDARRLLKPAIDTSDGRFSEDTVMTAIKSGFYQLWMVFDEDNRPAAAFVMELIGRAGWKKFLQKNGWSATYLVCERNFDKEALEEEEEAA